MHRTAFFLPLFLFVFSASAQNPDPDAILTRIKAKMDRVNDYRADITIRLNLDMLKIPEKKAVMYYKKPDKIHFETKGFALIPKKASNFQQRDVLNGKYTALSVRNEMYEGRNLSVIKVIPMDDASDVVLSTVWADPLTDRIYRMESVTRNEGSVNLVFFYGNKPFDLPEAIRITFEVAKTELPMGITGDFESGLGLPEPTEDGKKSKRSKGTVWVTYENYVVNKGIEDSVFEKKPGK
jgi:hypothetical protein